VRHLSNAQPSHDKIANVLIGLIALLLHVHQHGEERSADVVWVFPREDQALSHVQQFNGKIASV
jgi:hypothetical protein